MLLARPSVSLKAPAARAGPYSAVPPLPCNSALRHRALHHLLTFSIVEINPAAVARPAGHTSGAGRHEGFLLTWISRCWVIGSSCVQHKCPQNTLFSKCCCLLSSQPLTHLWYSDLDWSEHDAENRPAPVKPSFSAPSSPTPTRKPEITMICSSSSKGTEINIGTAAWQVSFL